MLPFDAPTARRMERMKEIVYTITATIPIANMVIPVVFAASFAYFFRLKFIFWKSRVVSSSIVPRFRLLLPNKPPSLVLAPKLQNDLYMLSLIKLSENSDTFKKLHTYFTNRCMFYHFQLLLTRENASS